MTDEPDATKDVGLPSASVKILVGAIIFTVLWIIAAGVMVFHLHGGTEEPTKLNEWGDFVAGVSAPIAFIWLVVAVFLQSTELREQRKELALTRQEFKNNREVMKAQAVEARRQAEFIDKQTQILADNHAQAVASEEFEANVALVATRLVQYRHAFSFYIAPPHGTFTATRIEVITIRSALYEDKSDPLVIATTAQTLRTQLRHLRNNYSGSRLATDTPMDFHRIYIAVMGCMERLALLPHNFQIKAQRMELHELKKHLEIIAPLIDDPEFLFAMNRTQERDAKG